MNKEARVFIVDDDASVRDSISFLLDSVDIPYTAFPDALSFLDTLADTDHGCLVLDIRMPGMSGLDLQARLIELDVAIPIVFITGHGDIPMAVEAMRRGAVDFIRKPFRDQELLDRINEALSKDANERAQADSLKEMKAAISELTPREVEIFERVCDGQANKVMAIDLGISERTIEIHRGQVMKKTGARSLAELVRLKIALEASP